MKGFFSFLITVALLAVVAGFVLMLYKYTNGFNEDFKTFYVEYEGEQILTSDNKMTFKKGTHRYDVKYTFDREEDEKRDFTVKIVPNVVSDFDYTVDNKKYKYSKLTDLSSSFNLVKKDTYFEFTITENMSIISVISAQHSNKNVQLVGSPLKDNPYPFKLIISSYSGNVTYNILFNIPGAKVTGVQLDQTALVF